MQTTETTTQPRVTVSRGGGAGYVDIEHAVMQALARGPVYTGVPDALDEQLWPGTGWVRMPPNLPVIDAPPGTACEHCERTGRELFFWPPTTDGAWTCADHRGCWCTETDCCGGE
ncbi:hypothetical protein [Micromonospora zamorensis]|uniref:hypothetical protein n=1 Tax=Micromonospora zamorensis TaxID=709883 RepID=UPI0033E83E46